MGKIESTEAGLKQQDSVADKISEMLERYQNRLTLDNTRFIERYLKGELHILLHFSVRQINEQFVAYFQRDQIPSGSKESVEFRNDAAGELCLHHLLHFGMHKRAEVNASEVGVNGNQKAMLIDSVKAIENGKVTALPSVVWFDTIDRVYSVLPQALYFSRRIGFELRGIAVSGELNAGWHRDSRIINGKQLYGQMIEGAPEILNSIADDGGKGNREWLNSSHVIDQLSRVRIALGPDFIWVGVAEGADLSLEITDMLFGPVDFYLNKRKSLIGSQ